MNQVSEQEKQSILKTLAIVGFLAAIVLLVFVAVKVVSYLPSAFSSLASLADSVYNADRGDSLKVGTDNSVVKTGDAFTINWSDLGRSGIYTFSYTCTEGVTVQTRNAAGEIVTIPCDSTYTVGVDQFALDLSITTDRQRFTDVTYAIGFTPNDPRREANKTEARVTIVNASIPTDGLAVETPTEPEVEVETPVTPPEPSKPTTPSTPVPPTYVTKPVVVYKVPVSDPKGSIDLTVHLLGVKTSATAGYSLEPRIEAGNNGSIRFSIRNFGTKTASNWSYRAELPDGIIYRSPVQQALKPQEEAIITLSFTGAETSGSETIKITVDADHDVNTKNNSTTHTVKFVD